MATSHPTRDALISRALELFAADGFRGTTVRRIEEAVGLTPGAGGMYRHFRSKDDLLLAAVECYHAEVLAFGDEVPDLIALDDLHAELMTAATKFREFHERHDTLMTVMVTGAGSIPPRATQLLEAAWQQGYRMYADWLARRLPPDTEHDIEATAIQLFGSLATFHAQARTFAGSPLGVDEDRFVRSWADHWTTFLGPQSAPP